MKTPKSSILAFCCAALLGCSDLDLSPRDEAATGNWFQTAEQFEMNLNAILLHQFWPQERNEWNSSNQCELDALTDDFTNRTTTITFNNGNLNGTNPVVTRMWDITYSGINRCNKIITELRKLKASMDPDTYNRIEGNARFYRACFYARLLMHFGDVVVVDEDIDIETEAGRNAAYLLERQDRWQVLEDVLSEFDAVVDMLPREYAASEVQRATKGAAYGMKARTALHFASIRKWDTYGLGNIQEAERLFGTAADAASKCMELGVYRLHEDFGKLFLQSTKNSPEGIFVIPRSKILSNGSKWQYLNGQSCTAKLSRLSGASTCTTVCPSWDLLCSFLCDDGLPIDESPRYDPSQPFKNRDPRCAYTIVEFGTKHLGVIYDPHFDKETVYSDREGKEVTNNDSRTYRIEGTSNQYASYNGLVLRKGIDEDWLRSNPYVCCMSAREFWQKFHDQVLIIHAHPYRDGNTVVFEDAVHGTEIINGNPRHDNHNDLALDLARRHPGFFRLAGSDTHQAGDEARAGVILPEKPADSFAYKDLIEQRRFRLWSPEFQSFVDADEKMRKEEAK